MSLHDACLSLVKASALALAAAAFFAVSPVRAGIDDIPCATTGVIAENVIAACPSNMAASAERILSAERKMDLNGIAPRSDWIRVAPLVTKRCCGGYSCDQTTGTCVCKQWC